MTETQGHAMADLLLINGKIVTVDPDFSILEAVAVKDGKFLAVGTTSEMKSWKRSGTEMIDLKEKRSSPG